MSEALIQSMEVRAVFPEMPTKFDPTPFINAAHAIMDRVLIQTGLVQDGELLKQLEAFVAAHLAWQVVPGTSSESGTGVGATKNRAAVGKGIDASPFGTIISSLEPTGKLVEALTVTSSPVFESYGPTSDGGSTNPLAGRGAD